MKKQIISAFAFSTAVSASAIAYAASTDVDTEVSVSQTALAISTTQTLNFGNFEITASDAQGTIEYTDTNTVAVNATNIVHNGGAHRGQVDVSGTPNAPIEYSCSLTSTLVHETDPTRTMTVSALSIGHSPCSSGPLPATLDSAGRDNGGLRGTLEFDSPIAGNYSSVNPGGVPITVDVVYQ